MATAAGKRRTDGKGIEREEERHNKNEKNKIKNTRTQFEKRGEIFKKIIIIIKKTSRIPIPPLRARTHRFVRRKFRV